MSHRLALALCATALVAGAATPALAAGHPAGHAPVPARTAAHQRFAITDITVANRQRPTRVVAAGPIQGRGTMTERVLSETDTSSVIAATIKLADGTVRLRVHDTSSMSLDLHSCTARDAGKGRWRIVSGTGAYRDAGGSGTFVRRSFIIGAFGARGRCLGRSAAPAAVTANVVADGTATS